MTRAEAERIIQAIRSGRAFAAGSAEQAWGVECRADGTLWRWSRDDTTGEYREQPIGQDGVIALFQGYSYENIRRWVGLPAAEE